MRRLAPVSRLVCLLSAGALLAGGLVCRSVPTGRAAEARGEGQASPVPDDFHMVFGQGGGFTGQWQGYTIRADGTVLAWSGRMAEEEARPAGRLSAAQMAELWRQIQAARYFEDAGQEVGNLTAFITLTAGGRRHRRSWIPGAEGFEPARSPVDALYRYSLTLARRAEE